MRELQEVTFLANKTNASPKPAPVEKKPSNTGAELIAIFNFCGIAWLLRDTPAIGIFVAGCVACASLTMRRSFWLKVTSFAATFVIACAFIVRPPSLATRTHYYRHTAAVDQPQSIDDWIRVIGIYLVTFAAAGAVHRIAGEPIKPIDAAPPIAPKPPEDPEAKIKRKAFDLWYDERISSVAIDVTTPFSAIFADYKRAISAHLIQPKAYAAEEFKKIFKDSSGRDPVEIKGDLVYQGIAFTKAGLI